MRLIVLGSGTASPHAARASSGYWLETSAGSIALDMSAAAVHRAAQENLEWWNLDAVWFSHFHLDHIGGFPAFLFGTKYAFETQERTKPLKIFSAPGFRGIIETIDSANDYNLFKQPFPLEFVEVEAGNEFEILPSVKGLAFNAPHIESSLAIRITEGEKSMLYTGDTGFSLELGEFAKGVDLFLTECAFVEKSPTHLHVALPECVEMLCAANPKRALLTHFYGEWDNVDFQTEVAKYSPPCEVLKAEDGLRVEI